MSQAIPDLERLARVAHRRGNSWATFYGDIFRLLDLLQKTETALKRERSLQAVQWRKSKGRPVGSAPLIMKIAEYDGVKVLQWDEEQIRIVLDIAERLAKGETPEQVLVDLWSHGIKDQRGRPWGQPRTRDGRPPTGGFVRRIYRAVRRLREAQRDGTLPEPYASVLLLIPEHQVARRGGFS